MDPNQSTMLLASIDHTLATVRAALAAGENPEQAGEARTELSSRAGADVARLVFSCQNQDWGDPPAAVVEPIRNAGDAADQGDLARAETELTAAREALGGRSR